MGADIVLKRIEKCLEILVLKNNLSFEQIDALGIGVPGLLNRNDGYFFIFSNFNNWHNVKIKEWFEHKWLIPTVIDNDVRMHLYGELYFGAGKGFKILF
ncbi:MAG: ROK family protein [Coprobacillus cateniformis]